MKPIVKYATRCFQPTTFVSSGDQSQARRVIAISFQLSQRISEVFNLSNSFCTQHSSIDLDKPFGDNSATFRRGQSWTSEVEIEHDEVEARPILAPLYNSEKPKLMFSAGPASSAAI